MWSHLGHMDTCPNTRVRIWKHVCLEFSFQKNAIGSVHPQMSLQATNNFIQRTTRIVTTRLISDVLNELCKREFQGKAVQVLQPFFNTLLTVNTLPGSIKGISFLARSMPISENINSPLIFVLLDFELFFKQLKDLRSTYGL